jgi:amidase
MAVFNQAYAATLGGEEPPLTPGPMFTVPADFAGTPSLSLQCGQSTEGLPYTLQLMGADLTEAMLCRIGHAYEEATDWNRRHPPV